jgi:lia operon protein LiaG
MRMNHRISGALAFAALLSSAHAAGAQTERMTLQGSQVSIHNLAGVMRVEAGSGGAVQVEVTRAGPDAGELRVVRRNGSLAVVYPGDRVVYPQVGRNSSTQLTVRDDGTFGGRGSGGRRVRITGSGEGTEAWADVVVRVPEGATLRVHQAVGRVEVSNVNGNLTVDSHSAAIRAEGTSGVLTLDTGSGGIDVRGARGELLLDTGSGGVRLADVDARRLTVDTGSGGVRGSGVRADVLRVDVGSGGVALDDVAARDAEVDTGSGSVRLALTSEAERVRIDTGSGGVTLTLPRNFGAEMEIGAGSGGIDVDVPVTARRASRGSFSGTVGDGRGRVEIDTGSGGVRVRGS